MDDSSAPAIPDATEIPNASRIYNYTLGGTHDFPADHAAHGPVPRHVPADGGALLPVHPGPAGGAERAPWRLPPGGLPPLREFLGLPEDHVSEEDREGVGLEFYAGILEKPE